MRLKINESKIIAILKQILHLFRDPTVNLYKAKYEAELELFEKAKSKYRYKTIVSRVYDGNISFLANIYNYVADSLGLKQINMKPDVKYLKILDYIMRPSKDQKLILEYYTFINYFSWHVSIDITEEDIIALTEFIVSTIMEETNPEYKLNKDEITFVIARCTGLVHNYVAVECYLKNLKGIPALYQEELEDFHNKILSNTGLKLFRLKRIPS